VSIASTKPAATTPILDSSVLLVSADEASWNTLAGRGYRVLRARTAAEGVALYAGNRDISVVVADLALADGDGLDMVEAMRERDAGGNAAEFLLVAGDEALPAALRAIRLHVLDFLVRPLEDETLLSAVSDAYNVARHKRFQREEARALETSLAEFKMRTHAAVTQLIARAQDAYSISPSAHAMPMNASPEDRALQAFIQEESERARLREKIFGPLVQNHAVWMLLLALWDSQQSGTELTIKSVAYTAGLPLSSALRKINEMCASGLVQRRGDPDDARRSFVTLTPQGQTYFARFFSEWSGVREVRKLASGE
jgi:ActR/RegA family two-component response regulator/DNA-binding MarR family transcriptional regulator